MFYKVFMDTNIYDGANYSFRNAMFQCLREYATKDELCLVVNSIIEGEVRSHIRDRIKEQITKLNKVVTDRTFTAFKHLAPFMDIIEKKNPDDWKLILEKEMCAALKKSSSAAEWMEKMLTIVEQRGADKDMDNYSAITVWM